MPRPLKQSSSNLNQTPRRWREVAEFWKKNASRPVSRVLYGPRSLRSGNVAAIHLGHMLPCASRNLPGQWAGNSPEGFPSYRPYSVLLPVGFALPLPLPVARWALTPPFHPYRALPRRARAAVCFLWHFPWGHPRRPLAGTVSPWSPDFPHPQPFDSRWCGRPAGWQAYKGVRDPKGKSACSRYPQLPRNELERRAVGSMAAKPLEPYAQINQRRRFARQPCGNRQTMSGSYAWHHGRHCT